jgi:hypothetical protein
MLPPSHDHPVLVPVANPASIGPLLGHAAALAGPDGTVQLLTVLGPSADADDIAHAEQGLIEVQRDASDLGIQVRGDVRTAEDVASGVLDVVEEASPALVVMGWRGRSSSTDVFGRLIDHVVGRSSVPLAVVRLGLQSPERILFPVSEEHLLPGGSGSLDLAVELTRRVREHTGYPTTVLRTGARTGEIPEAVIELGDRVHHDPRRTHKAVEAFSRPTDLIVAAVAPTASGLRGATTHLAWAAPEATLMVAVDVGPTRGAGIVDAVADAGQPAPIRLDPPKAEVRIVVTIRLPEHEDVDPARLEEILRSAGDIDLLMSWWPASDDRGHVGATVTVRSDGINAAMAKVMTTVHEAPELQGAEITYELDRGAPRPSAGASSASATGNQ